MQYRLKLSLDKQSPFNKEIIWTRLKMPYKEAEAPKMLDKYSNFLLAQAFINYFISQ